MTSDAALRVSFLERTPPFALLRPTQRSALASQCEDLAVEAGAAIVREGEVGDVCYVVRRGRVAAVHHEGPDGAEHPIAELGEGALFGEAALLTTSPRNATVRALERCDLLVVR